MPAITGRLVVILTVTDLFRSEDWYRSLLSMESHRDVLPDGQVGQVILREPQSRLELCLITHPTSTAAEPFSETRTGLDHLEFLVASLTDLDEWAAKLDQLGIKHSGVKQPSHTANAMITFRDPDNIQLEFFGRPRPRPDARFGALAGGPDNTSAPIAARDASMSVK